MPPPLALLLAAIFITYLLRRDSQQTPSVSSAVWIPTIWLLILGSRSVSQWLGLGTPFQSPDQLLEGSPTDLAVYAGLIGAASVVLWRRRLSLSETIRNNPWLSLFLLYAGISILWSEFPFVSFKRWIKSFGDPLMALVLLTDPMPSRAIEAALKRCAYVLIPLSIVFIKYYPHLGRTYSEWTGGVAVTGVTTNKNLLGYLLFTFGLFFVATLLAKGTRSRHIGKRADVMIAVLFLLMIQWLFGVADSMTALVSFVVGSLVILASRFAAVARRLGAYAISVILICAILQAFFPLTTTLVEGTGRDATLTGRTDLWASVLKIRDNDLVGAGYEAFWLGDRLKALWSEYYFRPNQAHNGYLEMFLNLGWIGLCLFGFVLWSGYRMIRKRLVLSADDPGNVVVPTFAMAFLIAYLFYNVTEGTFKALNFLFIVFLFVTMEYPEAHQNQAPPAARISRPNRRPVRLSRKL